MTVSHSILRDHLGAPIAWREAGESGAPVALFLHGLGGHRSNWDAQLAPLSDLRLCVAWDAPGYGDSPGLLPSLPEVADTVDAWLEQLTREADDRRVDVVGLSFGGMVAQHLALAHPDRIRTLALLDTSPAFGFDGVTTRDGWVASRIDPIRSAGMTAERARMVVDGLVGPQCPDDIRELAVASMRAVPTDSLAAACQALVDHDTLDDLHRIDVPTLVLVGEQDTETPPTYAQAIADRIPGALLQQVPGAGHLINWEAPVAVEAALRTLWGRA